MMRCRGSSRSLAAPIGDGVGPIQGYGGGTWGKGFDPFLIGCTDKGQVEIPSLKLADGLSPARLADRRYLLGEIDRLRARRRCRRPRRLGQLATAGLRPA